MFSLSSTVQPQVTIPLSHLINAFHSPKNISVSVNTPVSQKQHRDTVPEHEAPSSEPVLNLRDLGLSELKIGTDHITTGASSDFDNATKIAKRMVTKFGMSEKLGVMTYSDTGKLSPETQSAIEQEIRILLRESYERAKHILKTHAKEHKNLAEALLTYETLDAKEIQIVLEGKKLEVR